MDLKEFCKKKNSKASSFYEVNMLNRRVVSQIKKEISKNFNRRLTYSSNKITPDILQKRSSQLQIKKTMSLSKQDEEDYKVDQNVSEFQVNSARKINKKMSLDSERLSIIFSTFYQKTSSGFLKSIQSHLVIKEDLIGCFQIALLEHSELKDCILIVSKLNIYLIKNHILNDQNIPEISQSQRDRYQILTQTTTQSSFSVMKPNTSIFENMVKIKFSDVQEIHTKRFWLRNSAIEIYTKIDLLFLVVGIKQQSNIYNMLVKIFIQDPQAFQQSKGGLSFVLKNQSDNNLQTDYYLKYCSKIWENGDMCNFDFLLLLNKLAGRTFADTSQYPVFPWIIADYTSQYHQINLNTPTTYRDLTKPIAAQIQSRVQQSQKQFNNSIENGVPFHYGSHYSTPGIILYFMLRLMPFTQMAKDLQGGKFDIPDRLFYSIEETYRLSNTLDNKELIPEFFFQPEFLLNISQFQFGKKENDYLVDNIELPQWAVWDPRYFVMMNRKALESSVVSQNLHQWINLIFGYKQQGKYAEESMNVFYMLTYEGAFQVEQNDDPNERNAILDQINEFGQTPIQLFKKPIKERQKINKCESIFYSLNESVDRIVPTIIGTIQLKDQVVKSIMATTSSQFSLSSSYHNDQKFSGLKYFQNIIQSEIEIKNQEFQYVIGFKNQINISPQNTLYFDSILNKLYVSKNEIILQNNTNFAGKFIHQIEQKDQITINDNSVNITDENIIQKGQPQMNFFINLNIKITSVVLNKDHIILGCQNGMILIYNFLYHKEYKLCHHRFKIIQMVIIQNEQILISVDSEGWICFYNLQTYTIKKKTQCYHFYQQDIYNLVFQNKITISESSYLKDTKLPIYQSVQREKIIKIDHSFHQGDILFLSKNYISLYNINSILLACVHRKNFQDIDKFSTAILVSNKYKFEDNYIISGHINGTISFWIMSPNFQQIQNRIQIQNLAFIYNLHYQTITDSQKHIHAVFPPYQLNQVFQIKNDEQQLNRLNQITALCLCDDQSKVISVNKLGQIMEWKIDFQQSVKQCANCKKQFGLLLQKQICLSCNQYNCHYCTKKELFIPEVNLKKSTKICDKCYDHKSHKVINSLYDNYNQQ